MTSAQAGDVFETGKKFILKLFNKIIFIYTCIYIYKVVSLFNIENWRASRRWHCQHIATRPVSERTHGLHVCDHSSSSDDHVVMVHCCLSKVMALPQCDAEFVTNRFGLEKDETL